MKIKKFFQNRFGFLITVVLVAVLSLAVFAYVAASGESSKNYLPEINVKSTKSIKQYENSNRLDNDDQLKGSNRLDNDDQGSNRLDNDDQYEGSSDDSSYEESTEESNEQYEDSNRLDNDDQYEGSSSSGSFTK